MTKPYHTWIEISPKALKANLEIFKNLAGEKTEIAAIIKSNAYGHGLVELAGLLMESGSNTLGVNSWEEAKIILQAHPSAQVLIMGAVDPTVIGDTDELSRCIFAVSDSETAIALKKKKNPPSIHLKIDSGMGRLGIRPEDLETTLENLTCNGTVPDGLMTHFASTEDFTEHSYTKKQIQIFENCRADAETILRKKLICHCASSASAMLFPEARMDLIRIGISLYGLWPSLETRLSLTLSGEKPFQLRPILSWKTKIVLTKFMKTGEYIGYGSTYKVASPAKIAVVPVGYFEGIDRKLSNQGYMLVNGERARIIGRVCMNMTILDISHIPNTGIGDEVTILGVSGGESVSADDHAEWANTINYEIVSKLQKDIPRLLVD